MVRSHAIWILLELALTVRRFLIGAALLLVVLLIGTEWVVESIALEPRRAFLERKLSRAFGLEVKLNGDLELGWLPQPHVEAAEITVANLPGRPSAYLAEIGSVEFHFNLWKLLRRVPEVGRVRLRAVQIRVEGDENGTFAWEHELESLADESEPANDPVPFRIRELVLEDVAFFYRRSAQEPVVTLHLERLSLEDENFAGPLTLEVKGDIDGSPFDLHGRFGSLEQLLNPTEPFPLALSGQLFEAQVELEGTLETLSPLAGLDLALSASLPNLGVLPGDVAADLRVLGPVTLSGRLRHRDGLLGVEDLELSTRSEGPTRVRLTGGVRDLSTLRGVDVELRVESTKPVLLEALFGRQLPRIGTLLASAHISDDDGTLGVEGDVRVNGVEEAFSIALVGDYGDLARMQEIEVDVQLTLRDLEVLGKVLSLPQELPPIGPVRASAKVRNRNGSVGLYDLRVQVGREPDTWARIEGSVRDVLEMEGIELALEFGARDLTHLSSYLERELPDIGPARASATLSDRDGSLGFEMLSLRASREEMFEVELSGSIDDLRDVGEISLEARLEARDLSVLGALAGVELPPIGPVRFQGQVRGSDERLVSSGQGLLDLTTFRGEILASFAPGARPRIRVRVDSPHVYLDDIGISPELAAAGKDRSVVRTVQARRAAQEQPPSPFEQLRSLDADVVLRAERITGAAGLELLNSRTRLVIDDGHLTVSTKGVIEGGEIDVELQLDTRSPEPRLALRVEAGPIDLSQLMSQFEENPEQAGVFDLSLDLRSHGSSRSQILSHLEGRASLMGRDSRITSRYGRMFVREFIKVSVPELGNRKRAPVACFLVELAIEDGIAEVETLHLEGEGVTITGSGSIDLPKNTLDLRLVPTMRDPGLLSIAVTVNATGSLTDPDFRPLRRTFVTSAIRGLLSNATRIGRVALRPVSGTRATPEQMCASSLRASAKRTPDVASRPPKD